MVSVCDYYNPFAPKLAYNIVKKKQQELRHVLKRHSITVENEFVIRSTAKQKHLIGTEPKLLNRTWTRAVTTTVHHRLVYH